MKKWFALALIGLTLVIILGGCGAPSIIMPSNNDGGLPPCGTIATINTSATVDTVPTDCYQPPYVPPPAPTTIPPLPDDCIAGVTRWSMQPCDTTVTTTTLEATQTVISEPFPRGTLPGTV